MVLAHPANASSRNVVYEIDLAREHTTTRWFVSEITEQQSSENESES
jgi:hypothetical protein